MRKLIIAAIAFTLSSLFVSPSMAEKYVMEETITAMAPVFMLGHEGDPTMIEGFEYESAVSMAGKPIGTAVAKLQLWAPPMDMAVPISWMNAEITYSFDGLGSIEGHSIGIAYGDSDAAATGDIVVSASGSVRNGTDGLAGYEGVLTWYGSPNIFTLTGTGTVIFNIP